MYIIISMKLVSLNLRLIKLKKVSSRSDERLIISTKHDGLYIMNLQKNIKNYNLCNKSYESSDF